MRPRRELFADSGARVVWAALQDLGREQWFAIYERLGEMLATGEGGAASKSPHERRVARALGAVHEAAAILREESGVDRTQVKLSVEAYRRLRVVRPEAGWPPDGSIRRWLGGSWNDVLRRADLKPVPDGDALVREVGRAFTRQECLEALKGYAADTGDSSPLMWRYLAWARQPEVKQRPGRRPSSERAFHRTFGSWHDGLVAAGLAQGSGENQRGGKVVGVLDNVDAPIAIHSRSAYGYSDEQVRAALREIAGRLGRSPKVVEYVRERQAIYLEEARAGKPPRPIPSSTLIMNRGTWDEMLRSAGLAPTNGRYCRRPKRGPVRRIYSDEELLQALRRADRSVKGRLTLDAYAKWRNQQIASQDPKQKKGIPTASAMRRFGGWVDAVEKALGTK